MLEQVNQQIEEVSRRVRRYRCWKQLSISWIIAAVTGIIIFSTDIPLQVESRNLVAGLFAISILSFLPLLVFRRNREKERIQTVRLIESAFPDLNDRLLAACDQQPNYQTGKLGFLQKQVVNEVLRHNFIHDWKKAVPTAKLFQAACMHLVCVGLFAAVASALLQTPLPVDKFEMGPVQVAKKLVPSKEYGLSVEPGNTSIERGTSLLVLARFSESLPAQATLVFEGTGENGTEKKSLSIPLAKSLDDPIFGGRVPNVRQNAKYHVEYDSHRSEQFQLTVFDYPELEQADATISLPEFTGLPETVIEDTLQVTIVEGSSVSFICRINKPIVSASLQNEAGESLVLSPIFIQEDDSVTTQVGDSSAATTSLFRITLQPEKSQRFTLHLLDAEERANKQPPEIQVDVVPNQPAKLNIAFPARDLRASPLEEVSLEATAWDDFGIKQYGIIYSLAESDPETIVLGGDAAAKEEHKMNHLLSFESISAEPDQLVSYYFYADDFGPQGKVRRTFSDMFFAEIRHFDEIFRQGPQMPSGGKKKGGGSPNAQKAEKLAELQKQIINATWKLIRRETSTPPTDEFEKDVTLIHDSQANALKQVEELASKLRDAKSKAYISTVAQHMKNAILQLSSAVRSHSASPLSAALAAEQSAYQALLKLRAREHKVSKSQNGGGGKGGSGNRSQQQLQQLELTNKQNRYETQKNASKQQQPQENKEQLQVLNRLRELARRQKGVNEKLKEIENELRLAKTEQEKEELKRQLKRLREEQKELLQDVDNLRNRMDKPENQQKMADSRKQLEQTRNNVRQSSEALKKGQVSKALNTGTRAERQLNNLRDEFRKKTAGRFSESMRNLREDARKLTEKQQELSEQLANANNNKRRTLRGSQERQQIEKGLGGQKKQLGEILDKAKNIIQQAENTEPLLSKQLYDTIRKSREEKPADALEATRQLTNRGLLDEAQNAEKEASKGLESIRRGIETAARGVLGDEVESLKRAKEELKQATEEVKDELAQANPEKPEQQSPNSAAGQPEKNSAANREQKRAGTQTDNKSKSNQSETPDSNPSPANQKNQNTSNSSAMENGKKTAAQAGQPSSKNASPKPASPGSPPMPPGAESQAAKSQVAPKPTSAKSGSQGQKPGQPSSKGSSPGKSGSQSGKSPSASPGKNQSKPNNQQKGQGQPNSQGSQNGTGSKPSQGSPKPSGPKKPSSFLAGGGTTGGRGGPLTGGNFQQWSDRLRNIEEMVEDPKLRAEVAKIRERARSMRVEFKRHSKEPEWPLVQKSILEPLVELQQRISEEIARRNPDDSLVPIDRDPVPERYSELVRRYYEKLGTGK